MASSISMERMRTDDAILWASLVVFGIAAFYQARRTLYEFREATVVTAEEKIQGVIGQHTEDAISVDTLGVLYHNSNHNIKEAALNILLERGVRWDNLKLLFDRAHCNNPEKREQALATLAYLAKSKFKKDVFTQRLFPAVLSNLVAHLPDVRKRSSNLLDDWKMRSNAERSSLAIVKATFASFPPSASLWIQVGLIPKWLWPYIYCLTKDEKLSPEENIKHRHKLVEQIMNGETDDKDLAKILIDLCGFTDTRTELKKLNIVGRRNRYMVSWDSGQEPESTNLSTTAILQAYAATRGQMGQFRDGLSAALRQHGSQNQVAEDDDQAATRRRHREAVVIGDVGQPLSQDNIFNASDLEEEFEGFRRVE